ncbi:hypothetical protein B0H13DRAFT_1916387 [Mycena leptocephala]|nr:hypothetical protein B0H13DRAFT_1916387 [Mycena leptocephala]
MAFRYQPYTSQTSPQPCDWFGEHPLTGAYRRLRHLNLEEGKLCTWSHGIINDWEEVPRPQRVTSRGPVFIAASGLDKAWGKQSSPIFCPHTRANGSPYNPLFCVLVEPLKGGWLISIELWTMNVRSKVVVVKPLTTRKLLLTWEDQQKFLRNGQGTPLSNTSQVVSFYGRSVADARKTGDISIMEYLHQIDISGVLEGSTLCLDRTYNYLQFVYKPLGQVIRQLNCAVGVPYADYANLIRATESCACCKNQFSGYGYNAHIKDGLCSNHPDLHQVEECSVYEPEYRFRSFRDSKTPKTVGETLDTAVGAALLEWNSRLGVPADVWLLISTAIVHCPECDLVRSFPAHLLHVDDKVVILNSNFLLLSLTPNCALYDGEASVNNGIPRTLSFTVLLFSWLQKLPWPTVGGHQVLPQHMHAYLLKEKVFWPLNLDDIYSTSTTRAAYVPIGKANLEPDSLLARYLLTDDECNMKDPLLFARYASGYLGEHGEREQLGKLVLGNQTGELSDDELSYKSFGVQVDTPYSFFPPQALSVLNIDEAQSLCRLAQGQGVSREEGSSLLSPCKACGNLFLKRLVANHSLTCTRIS